MLEPATDDMLPPPSSPTNSSVSSSDLDTESTGSFFHDRSTTLGTLMGVTFTFRAPSQPPDIHAVDAAAAATASSSGSRTNRTIKSKKTRRAPVELVRRRKWWRLCSDTTGAKPASLGEFLEVERRFGDAALYSNAAAELEGMMVTQPRNGGGVDGRVLFAAGRVLPPADVEVDDDDDDGASTARILSRCPVSLTGICSGGVG